MRLTFLSHTAMGGPFVVGSHQLAKALAKRGHSVEHISAPITPAHLSRSFREPLSRSKWRAWVQGGEILDGVQQIVPLTALPWNIVRRSSWGRSFYSRWMLASPLRRVSYLDLALSDCILVDEPRFFALLGRLVDVPIIYRATDLYAQQRNDPSICDAERRVCELADVLVATSEPVADHLTKLSGKLVTIMPNGVEYEHFAAPLSGSRHPISRFGDRDCRAVYVGAFDARFGQDSLLCAARDLSSVTFVLVGPGSHELAQRLQLSNVVGLGAQSYDLIPRIFRECSVGLLPLSAAAENSGRSPMKLYEYTAAGLTVAATRTAELQRRNLASVCLSDSPQQFSHAVRSAFELARNSDVVANGRQIARSESWNAKAVKLEDLVKSARASRISSRAAFGNAV